MGYGRTLLISAVFFAGNIGGHSTAFAADFTAYEGRNAVQEGDGGAKKTVDDIDFWSEGAPPRKFKLLGYITDQRHKSGLIGKISMSNLESDVAELVKENGGDAAILIESGAETVGFVGNGYSSSGGWHTGAARGVQKQNSKYAVVKYVPDVEAENQAAALAATPSQAATSQVPSVTDSAVSVGDKGAVAD